MIAATMECRRFRTKRSSMNCAGSRAWSRRWPPTSSGHDGRWRLRQRSITAMALFQFSKHHSADRMLSTAIFFRTSGSVSPAEKRSMMTLPVREISFWMAELAEPRTRLRLLSMPPRGHVKASLDHQNCKIHLAWFA